MTGSTRHPDEAVTRGLSPRNFTTWLPVALTRASVRHPWRVLVLALALVVAGGVLATQLETEVGFHGYFGKAHPKVVELADHQSEFGVGSQVFAVVSCQQSPHCERMDEPWALDLLGRLHARLDSVPNVLSTTSLLNLPIVTGPMSSRPLAHRSRDRGYELGEGWQGLLEHAQGQAFFYDNLLSSDHTTAGVVIELASLESVPLRDSVLELLDRRLAFEQELGAEIYFTGEPMFNVVGAKTVDRDALMAAVGLFVAMFGVLYWIFRDPWLTVLPLGAIGPLYLVVQGATAFFDIPVSVLMSVVPIVVLIISTTSSVHFLSAFGARLSQERTADVAAFERSLVKAADEVGAGCFWAGLTTAAGFASFQLSVLQTFRDAGQMSALGCSLGFLAIFTVLPAAIRVRAGRGDWWPAGGAEPTNARLAAALFEWVRGAPRAVFAGSLAGLLLLASGVSWIANGGVTGFGEHSYVMRSIRFIEAELRKCDAMEIVVDLPPGKPIYDADTLRLLADLEAQFAHDDHTGEVWSFLDLLEEAFRTDAGRPHRDLDELIERRLGLMPLVASQEVTPTFWNEGLASVAGEPARERARVVVARGWHEAGYNEYVKSVRDRLAAVERDYAALGYRVELAGGMPLVDVFLSTVHASQWETLRYAFAIVSLVLIGLLAAGGVRLVAWSVVANFLPVLAMLGTMGWLGIPLDLTTALLGAILLVVVVDDTVHVSLRFRRERARGADVECALERSVHAVGAAILTSSLCLAFGFASMLSSEWAGLVTFGIFAALGVGLAVIGDLLLLPAALLLGGERRRAPTLETPRAFERAHTVV